MTTSEMLRALGLPRTTLVRTDSHVWMYGRSHTGKNANWIRQQNWSILKGYCVESDDDPMPSEADPNDDSVAVLGASNSIAPNTSLSSTSISSSTLP